MDTWMWAVIALAAAAFVALVALFVIRRRRTRRLKKTFGTEYDRTLDLRGGRRDAERDLVERRSRREEIVLRTLPATTAARYAAQWHDAQTRFVDAPADAVRDAHALLDTLLRDVGYPVDDFDRFDEQAGVVSVDHPDLTARYRSAHRVATANAAGQASTEDLRRAMVDYRALFEELLGDRVEA